MEQRTPSNETVSEAASARSARLRAVLTLEDLLALDTRLRAGTFEVVPGDEGDIPALVRLIRTRRMPTRVPLKFARSEELLAASWPRVHWLVARREGRLIGCLELRPVAGEADVWEMGSFSQAADNGNPLVPVKLMAAGFRTLVELGARAAVVEVHDRNRAMWKFLERLPFEREGACAGHPAFSRCRMCLRRASGSLPGAR